MSDSRRLVDKLWSYCNVLRDDGVGVIEYTEQLTYLLFLKMAHERATRKLNPQQIVPGRVLVAAAARRRGHRARGRLHRDPRRPRAAARHARHDLPQGAEPDPGPGQAQATHRRPDRPGELVGLGHRPQGRRLRGAALQGRLGQGLRRRAVLHAARPDRRRSSTCIDPDARRHRRRPRLRHRRLPARRPRARRPRTPRR